MIEFVGYLLIIGTGVSLGRIGGGGSMLAIPVLVYAFSMDMETATACSLFVVGATSIWGVVLTRGVAVADVRTVLVFAIPSMMASFLSRNVLVGLIPTLVYSYGTHQLTKDQLLLTIFSLMMIASSLMLLANRNSVATSEAARPAPLLMVLGFLVGTITGLTGSGGGFLIVPVLIAFGGLSFSTATGTSLLIIGCNSLLGFYGDLLNRSIDWRFLSGITTLSLLGLLLGFWWQIGRAHV